MFAAGNGKGSGDNCGCDRMVSSIYTIAVAGCDHQGKVLFYSERCASIMVTAYSSVYSKKGNPFNVVRISAHHSRSMDWAGCENFIGEYMCSGYLRFRF